MTLFCFIVCLREKHSADSEMYKINQQNRLNIHLELPFIDWEAHGTHEHTYLDE